MTKVIGVRFRKAGKVYYFSPGDEEIKAGQHVIVETARGVEYGHVVLGSHEVDDKKVIQPLKPVIRMATAADEEIERRNKEKEKEAFKICLEKIKKHELDMKLIDTEYTFDNNKVLFYFTADGRIDFRDLVKDLASVFKTRIELRQIGVRDETKIVGGIGICGRPLCCASYLSEFIPVSIKMAKEQNLSLNPAKISGMCGSRRIETAVAAAQRLFQYRLSQLIGRMIRAETDHRNADTVGKHSIIHKYHGPFWQCLFHFRITYSFGIANIENNCRDAAAKSCAGRTSAGKNCAEAEDSEKICTIDNSRSRHIKW